MLLVSTPQRAAKGGQQKGVPSLFLTLGHFWVTFSDASVTLIFFFRHFFVRLLLRQGERLLLHSHPLLAFLP